MMPLIEKLPDHRIDPPYQPYVCVHCGADIDGEPAVIEGGRWEADKLFCPNGCKADYEVATEIRDGTNC